MSGARVTGVCQAPPLTDPSNMDVTGGSLHDPRRFHRRLLSDLEPFSSLHLIRVGRGGETENPPTAADLQTVVGSWRAFRAQVPWELFVHPLFLQILGECNVMAQCVEARGRYRLQLRSDRKLHLAVQKEFYEKFGVEGRPVDRDQSQFVIVLHLLGEALKVGGRLRARLLEHSTSLLFPPLLEVDFCCSRRATDQLTALFANLKYPAPTEHALPVERFKYDELPAPELADVAIFPGSEQLEEWNLWCGAICTQSNHLFMSSGRRDAFISVCRLPAGPPSLILHDRLRPALAPLPGIMAAEVLEAASAALQAGQAVCLVGQTSTAQNDTAISGFALYVDHRLDYILCQLTPPPQ